VTSGGSFKDFVLRRVFERDAVTGSQHTVELLQASISSGYFQTMGGKTIMEFFGEQFLYDSD